MKLLYHFKIPIAATIAHKIIKMLTFNIGTIRLKLRNNIPENLQRCIY